MSDRIPGFVKLWAGAFPEPWPWRAAKRAGRPPGCALKGNLAADGERVDHLPGPRYYGRTRISPEQSERWFCSEAEVRTAG